MSKQMDAALRLARHVISSDESKNNNIVFSPMSIIVVLSMMANEYKEGPTKDQLLSFLGSDSLEDLNEFYSKIVTLLFAKRPDGVITPEVLRTPILLFANSIWLDACLSLNSSFKQAVCDVYCTKLISNLSIFVTRKDECLIESILPPGSANELTELISANAIYFKGIWDSVFSERDTKNYNFYLQNGTTVKVLPFMCTRGVQYILTFDDFKVPKLPYSVGIDRNRSFSMYIFLPNTIHGLPALVEKIMSGSVFLNEHLPPKDMEIKWGRGDYRIPKFKFGFGLEATDVIKKMGLDLPFKMGGESITEMSKSPLVYGFSEIYHKAWIEVNEYGTTAAAATMRWGGGGCCMSKPANFVADHPFAFLIMEDNTGSILFVGQVLNPLEN
ncbi:hypothetical protein ACFE04_028734 [Oxalis oulophora]